MLHKKPFILFFVHFICFSTTAQNKIFPGYSVYNAIIRTELADSSLSVVIVNHSEIENRSADLVDALVNKNKEAIYYYTKGKAIDSLTQQLIITYFKKQSKRRFTAKEFNLPVKTVLIKKKKLDKFFRLSVADGWKNFNQQYPKPAGLFTFSKIHFSSDSSIDVFYYSHSKGGLNGHGDLVIMEKADNQWRIKYLISLWQS